MRERFILAVEMHLHLDAMLGQTVPELIVKELTVLKDWSLIRTSCCLSSMKSWTTSLSRPMTNVNLRTNRFLIQSRHRNRKTMIQYCDPSHVAVSQSLRRCALGPHRDRRGVHFRRRHALVADYGHSAD
jgi:hypothetical protein